MTKNKNTVSYSADELRAKLACGEDRTDWQRVDRVAEADNEPAVDDDDSDETQDWDWTRAEVVVPSVKAQISLRIDPDVLAFFKQDGPGYQTRINAVLRSYMNAHRKERSTQ